MPSYTASPAPIVIEARRRLRPSIARSPGLALVLVLLAYAVVGLVA